MLEEYVRQYTWARKGHIPVYMLVTQDKYQLPLAVADTARELAQMVGVTESSVIACIRRGYKSRYVRVYIDLEEE